MSIFVRFGPKTAKGGIYGAILVILGLIIGSAGWDGGLGMWFAIAGIFCMAPMLVKISILVLLKVWKLIRIMIYQIFFEATRAMKDAKKARKG